MHPQLADAPLIVTTSWDDGHPSDFRVAELLEKYGLTGTFYVPCSNSEGKPVMSSRDIADLGRRFEIGGHTRDHVSLTDLPPYVAANQILANKHWLEDALGCEVRGFAYVRGHHNRVVRTLVDKAGFRYARTIKNMMSTPGTDRLRVPTTTQFFAHAPSIYLRNYLSGGATFHRAALLGAMLRNDGLVQGVSSAAETCARWGGFFHLWGHSWELDAFNLWGEFDRFLRRLREFDARFVTNADWCASIMTSTEASSAPVGVSQEQARLLSPARPTTQGVHLS
jgi:peptidoglycan/xylan/chitin deacetylase (PgdA/CDA1 family)